MKQTINISSADRQTTRTIEADVVGGIAVHRTVMKDGLPSQYWTVTHIKANIALGVWYESLAEAKRVRKALKDAQFDGRPVVQMELAELRRHTKAIHPLVVV